MAPASPTAVITFAGVESSVIPGVAGAEGAGDPHPPPGHMLVAEGIGKPIVFTELLSFKHRSKDNFFDLFNVPGSAISSLCPR
jgi:hypothetical protein